jgi:GDP-mannose 6-dehydrogenase
MNISVFGLGYVGCVSVGCLAHLGHKVIGVDVNQKKVELIDSGKPTIVEEGIKVLVSEGFKSGLISATSDYCKAIEDSEISVIAVGTPSTKEGHLNLEHIFSTASQIGNILRTKDVFHTVIIRSTVFPGTNKRVCEIIEKKSGKKRNIHFAVISNPEFLREGSAVKDFFNPPYTVIGTDSDKGFKIAVELYEGIKSPVERVDIEIAELIKYVNNTFHALKVSFGNEIGNICKKIGVDSHILMDLFIRDTHLNISGAYLKPGFAYGGSCLPKDLKALRTLSHDLYLKTPVIDSIEVSNEIHIANVLKLILEKGVKSIGILGLSFKEGTDDLRNSPMVELVETLLGKGYKISIFDLNLNISTLLGANRAFIESHIPHLDALICNNLDDVVSKSDLLIINQKIGEFAKLPEKYPLKQFVDLVRIDKGLRLNNYEGICW